MPEPAATLTPEAPAKVNPTVESKAPQGPVEKVDPQVLKFREREAKTPKVEAKPEEIKTPVEEKTEEVTPEPEEQIQGEPEMVQNLEINGKQVPVNEVLKDIKVSIPVGDEDYEFTGIDEVLMFAGKGIHSAQLNQKANQVIAETEAIVKESEAKVQALESSISQKVDEGVRKTLDDLFERVRRGEDPRSGQPLKSDEKGVMEEAIRTAQGLHGNKPEAKVEPVDIEAKVQEALRKHLETERSQANNNQKLETAKNIFTEATEPYSQKFLKADGKTVNPRTYNAFRNEVAEEAARLTQGKKITAEQGKQVMAQAVKNVLPDFEPFFSKPTATAPQNKIPLVKPGGGSAPVAEKSSSENKTAKFKSLGDFWDSKVLRKK